MNTKQETDHAENSKPNHHLRRNGAGKSTFGKSLAETLGYQFRDIEDYYFPKTDENYLYAAARTREEVGRLPNSARKRQVFSEIRQQDASRRRLVRERKSIFGDGREPPGCDGGGLAEINIDSGHTAGWNEACYL